MRLTRRDLQLMRDVALSHVLSRDQIISLGYFGSVTRANTRLRDLRELGYVKAVQTPFYAQQMYAVTHLACDVLGDRISPLVASRTGSPRFLQHALCVTNVRIAMLAKGATSWRFEQQLRAGFRYGGKDWQVRPDGLAVSDQALYAVEADLGHVGPAKFRDKLLSYDAFAASGECGRRWGETSFTLLVVTTGKLRASRLARQLPSSSAFKLICKPSEELGIPFAGAWS